MKELEIISYVLKVADLEIPLRIPLEELDLMGRVEAEINTKYNDYKSLYKDADKATMFSMVCIELATDLQKIKKNVEEENSFHVELEQNLLQMTSQVQNLLASSLVL